MMLIGAHAAVFVQRAAVRKCVQQFCGAPCAPHPPQRRGSRASRWCLSPYRMLQHGEWYRLLTTSFLHPNLAVFLHDMGVLLRAGLVLERGRGWRFLAQVAALAAASNACVCLSAVARALLLGDEARVPYMLPAAGLAGACSALRVLAAHDPAGRSDAWGQPLQLPGRLRPFSCWLHLALAPLAVPAAATRAYMDAQLAGLVAGLLWLHARRAGPGAWALVRLAGRGGGGAGRGARGYTLSGGQYWGGGGRLGSAAEEGFEVAGLVVLPLGVHAAGAAAAWLALHWPRHAQVF